MAPTFLRRLIDLSVTKTTLSGSTEMLSQTWSGGTSLRPNRTGFQCCSMLIDSSARSMVSDAPKVGMWSLL